MAIILILLSLLAFSLFYMVDRRRDYLVYGAAALYAVLKIVRVLMTDTGLALSIASQAILILLLLLLAEKGRKNHV